MDAAERSLLRETVRGALVGGTAADLALTDLGWLEMLEAEPRDAIDIVFTTLGETNSAATTLDDVVIAALGIEPRADVAVLLPPFAGWACPGHVVAGDVHASGVTSARINTASEVIVGCAVSAGLHRIVVPVTNAATTPIHGVDPGAMLHLVEVRDPAVDSVPLEPGAWAAAVAAGQRAVAHQITGASRTMLDLARTHAIERVQFDRPIAKFQAVRHRLAEALVAIEAAEAALVAAWDEPGPMTAALAKAAAGRGARTVAGHCQQVLAGIGFTTDHPFHRYLKRTIALDGLFGSTDAIVLDVGRQLLAQRRVPTLIEL